MAIANIVNAEKTTKLELKHPSTDKKLGIVFNIRSASSNAVKAVAREGVDSNIEKMQKSKFANALNIEDQAIAREVAAIESWDWGKNEYIKGEGAPKLTFEFAFMLLKKEDWIFNQVNKESTDIGNFIEE